MRTALRSCVGFAGALLGAIAPASAQPSSAPTPGAELAPPPPQPSEVGPARSAEAPTREGTPRDAQVPIAADAHRVPPDYDGRPEPSAPGRELGLGVLRVLTFPLYTVSEYVVRRPLGWLVTTAERHHWPTLLVDFFTFGPNRTAGFIPTALVDFRVRPSIGLIFFWNDFLVPDNDLRMRAAFGGADWWIAGISDRFALAPDQSVAIRGWYTQRPDRVFTGIGPESGRIEARYLARQLDGELEYFLRLWRTSSLESYVGLRDATFDPGQTCCDEPSVSAEVARGRFELPEGMSDGYAILRTGVQAALDTRPRRKLDRARPGSDFVSPPGDGFRVAVRAGQNGGLRPIAGARPEEHSRYAFVTYGATLGGYLDPSDAQRVLGFELIADFADPLEEGAPIPFEELVSLGGARPMRGFRAGRLRGRSTAVARFEYRWPVWVYVDGTFQYDVGNAFSAGLEDFDPELLRQSFALGLRMNNVRQHAFEMLAGIGTATFEDGSRVESVRLLIGASSGF